MVMRVFHGDDNDSSEVASPAPGSSTTGPIVLGGRQWFFDQSHQEETQPETQRGSARAPHFLKFVARRPVESSPKPA